MFRRISAAGLAAVCLALAASPATAGPKAPPGDSSIRLDQSDPHAGDVVTFTVSYPRMRESARVRVLCNQDGSLVYQNASDPAAGFHLWSMLWQSRAADCSADLFYFTYRGQAQTGVVYLAHTEFRVAD